ncbi:MAG: tRNA uridine-5-carboxymethylaminomethyl(34) synthesis enzyme MnmG [Candidatus Omnitrophica bacterium]|nr:tRNA uridine-5-carboxymethylaminomethyl(34) synthesis enzyme MnmG [Candidatus Omnitrophota bacterium]
MPVYPKKYDVIVVGAGHAGIEAALAVARMGLESLLLTINLDTIGQMSCNPAIGGSAKGQLAREIDAMGGEMGRNTDLTGLQFRMLNMKKGPSVWAPRAQCDKKAFQFRLKWICEREPRLDLKQAQVRKVLHNDRRACGVETTLGVQYLASAVILTTGTFLSGLMHIGMNRIPGGRAGEAAALGLSESLKDMGFELGRLKTGTPPRISRRSIDLSKVQAQNGDEPVPYISFWKEDLFHVEQWNLNETGPKDSQSKYPPGSILARQNGQLPCYVTYTTSKTADLIHANLDKSPLYSGVIEGVGPRYCPSIEDKIVKFPEKDRHQIFLEPEGIATEEFYVNGFSTSLPIDIQFELVKTIIGCESAEILRPAYAVEYDFVPPTQLLPTLETKICRNLFHAGQINGTSGYEEAGAQGLVAGINAALSIKGGSPLVLRRDQAYIGVLIDDLITKGTVEPYRMFTSRAEYRLLLRQDNADSRLTPLGHQLGLVSTRNYLRFQAKQAAIQEELSRLEQTRQDSISLAQLLRRPEVHYDTMPGRKEIIDPEVAQQVEIILKYSGYIERQEIDVLRFRNLEDKRIPAWMDYRSISSLRTEARLKLEKIRPVTLGQASRISGVSPADISLLLVWMKRGPQKPLPVPSESDE